MRPNRIFGKGGAFSGTVLDGPGPSQQTEWISKLVQVAWKWTLRTPPAANPLSHLARQLARKESQVQRLRRVYETKLAALRNRREQLAQKLRRLDAQIQAVAPESAPPTNITPSEEPAPSKPIARRGTLPALLVRTIEEAGRPLTIKEVAAEVRRRKFRTKSRNIPRLVQTRVYDLVRKGILARAEDQPGYIVASSGGQRMRSAAKGRTKVLRAGQIRPELERPAEAGDGAVQVALLV